MLSCFSIKRRLLSKKEMEFKTESLSVPAVGFDEWFDSS